MKTQDSSQNDKLRRLRIAPGNGDFEPFCGHVEIVFTGYDDNGSIVVYDPAKIKINVSFGEMELDEVKGWRDVFDVAVGLANTHPLPWTPNNVLEKWKEIKLSLK